MGLAIVDTHPNLLEEWDYEKNTISPNEVSYGSTKMIHWKCSKGHSWTARVNDRTNHESKCPFCSNRKVLAGYNDLETLYPEIAAEWDYEKNKETPKEVLSSCNEKVFWICKLGHSYSAYIYNRTLNSNGCPYCAGRKVLVGFNDLATTRPEFVKEWDTENNGDLTPFNVTAGSHKSANWVCARGHTWRTQIKSRVLQNLGCPICSGRKVLTGYNDLATTHKHLLEEWFFERNKGKNPQKLSYGSTEDVWWKCKKGHVWHAKINSRTANASGCPICKSCYSTSFPEQALYYYLKRDSHGDVFNRKQLEVCNTKVEIDVYLPSINVGVEYDGQYWHKGTEEKELKKELLLTKIGVKLYRIKESDKNTVDSNIVFYDVNDRNKNLIWAIQTIENWIGLENNIICLDEDTVQILEMRDYEVKQNSLQTKYPEIAKLWHPTKNGDLKPDAFSPYSNSEVWWQCPNCNGEWFGTIARHTLCPYCHGSSVLTGFNDFATKFPKMLKEWDFEKNIGLDPHNVTYGSKKEVWWKCKKGHSWLAKINSRTSCKSKCPYCNQSRLIKGFNDLATTNPELLIEWDYNKNTILPTEIGKGSHKSVWWKCSNGHEWQAVIRERVQGAKCRKCRLKGVKVLFENGDTMEYTSLNECAQILGCSKVLLENALRKKGNLARWSTLYIERNIIRVERICKNY